jgi:D-methionine transport system substrate-binding protein
MKIIERILTCLLVMVILMSTVACKKSEEQTANDAVIVGTISGPETELMGVAKKVAKDRYQLDLEIVQFSDYSMPNTALNDGSIDANVFQHSPYLEQTVKTRHYDLAIVGKTFIYPMGMYTKKIKTLAELPNNARVAIPNDPSNEARALLLLQKATLIKLGACQPQTASVSCVSENPKNLQITPLKAAQLPRTLADVDIALINTNYAIPAHLLPERDAVFLEDVDSLYANVIVVKNKDKNEPWVRDLVASLNSPEVLAAAMKIFDGKTIATWK